MCEVNAGTKLVRKRKAGDDDGKVGGENSEAGSVAGEADGAAGDVGGDAGKVNGDAGKVGGDAGKVGGDAGEVGGDAGTVGGTGDSGEVDGAAGEVGGAAGEEGGDAGKVGTPPPTLPTSSPTMSAILPASPSSSLATPAPPQTTPASTATVPASLPNLSETPGEPGEEGCCIKCQSLCDVKQVGTYLYCLHCAKTICVTCGGDRATFHCCSCKGMVHNPNDKDNFLHQFCSVVVNETFPTKIYCTKCKPATTKKTAQQPIHLSSERGNIDVMQRENNLCLGCRSAVATHEFTDNHKYCVPCAKKVCRTCYGGQAGNHNCRDCNDPIHNAITGCSVATETEGILVCKKCFEKPSSKPNQKKRDRDAGIGAVQELACVTCGAAFNTPADDKLYSSCDNCKNILCVASCGIAFQNRDKKIMWSCEKAECQAALKEKCPDNFTEPSIAQAMSSPVKVNTGKKQKTTDAPPRLLSVRLRQKITPPEQTKMQDKSEDEKSEAKATNNKRATWGCPLQFDNAKLNQQLVTARVEFFDFVKLPGNKQLEFKAGDYVNATVKDKSMDVVVVAACRYNKCADKLKTPDYRLQLLLCVGNGKDDLCVEDLVMILPGKCDAKTVTIQSKGSVTLLEEKQTQLLQKYFDNKRPVQGGTWSEGLDWRYKKITERLTKQISGKNVAKKKVSLKKSAASKKSQESNKSTKSTRAAASVVGITASKMQEYINNAINKCGGMNFKQMTDAVSASVTAAKKDQVQLIKKNQDSLDTSINNALQQLGVGNFKGKETLGGHIIALPGKLQTSIATAQSTLTADINKTAQDVNKAIDISTADLKQEMADLKTHTTAEMSGMKAEFRKMIADAVEESRQLQEQSDQKYLQLETDKIISFWQQRSQNMFLQGQVSFLMEGKSGTPAYDSARAIAYAHPVSEQALMANLQTVPLPSSSSTSSNTLLLQPRSPATTPGPQSFMSSPRPHLVPLNSLPTFFNPYSQSGNGLDTQNDNHALSRLTMQSHRSQSDAF